MDMAYFGVPKEMSKSRNFSLANLQLSLLVPVLATSVLHLNLEYPWKCPIVEIIGIICIAKIMR